MGARLVTQALNPVWANLSDTARLVLIAMCHTAKDQPAPGAPAQRYFAGHDNLILTLTGEDGALPPYRGSTAHKNAQRRVKRAIQELTEAGAIELVEPAHRGRQATYLVTPGPIQVYAAEV